MEWTVLFTFGERLVCVEVFRNFGRSAKLFLRSLFATFGMKELLVIRLATVTWQGFFLRSHSRWSVAMSGSAGIDDRCLPPSGFFLPPASPGGTLWPLFGFWSVAWDGLVVFSSLEFLDSVQADLSVGWRT